MVEKQELENNLSMFTGTEQYHRLTLGPLLATDGVAFLAKTGNCFWLIDAIASYQGEKEVKNEGFQIWFLRKKGSSATLTCHLDYSERNPDMYPPVITQEIEYTDFPLDEIKLYVQNGVVMLPSEY